MKTNLKTFPIWNVDDHLFIEKMQKWKEDFEAELRHQIKEMGDVTIHSMHDNVKGKLALQAKRDIIKEVLGEP